MKRKKLELLITGVIYFATGILSGILAILLLTHLHRLTDYFFAGSLAQNAFIPIVLSEIITIFLSLYDGRYAFHRCTLAQCFRRSIVASILFSAALALTLIIQKSGVTDSRYFFVTTGTFHLVILTAALYIVINFLIRNFYKTNAASLCMLVSTRSRAPQAAALLKHDWSRKLTAIALLDDDTATTGDVASAPPASQASEAKPSAQPASPTPAEIDHIPVLANRYTYIDYAKTHAIDEVFLIVDRDVRFDPGDAIQPFVEMGVKVHLNLLTVETLHENLQQADSRYIPATRVNLSYMEQDTPVLSIQQPEPKMRWMAAKRALDIVGAIVGLLITAVIFLFVAPAIKLDSPGPIFFAQTRIGKNGRRFKMYKFRSMYQDAEARKAALMQQNEMNGLMFKMKDDPPHHPRRPLPPPHKPRRIPPVPKRPDRRHEPRRHPPADRIRVRPVRQLPQAPPLHEARHHRPMAGQRPLRDHRLRRNRPPRLPLHRRMELLHGPPHPMENRHPRPRAKRLRVTPLGQCLHQAPAR